MESIKHKIGVAVLLLCITLIIAAIWYCLFQISENSGRMMEGTLVEACPDSEEVIQL